MSATRNLCTSKQLKAITTGADYGIKAAGAFNLGIVTLKAVGACLVISNPVALGIAGGIGVTFCCLGAGRASCEPNREEQMDHKLDVIQQEMDEVIAHQRSHHHRHHHHHSHHSHHSHHRHHHKHHSHKEDKKTELDVVPNVTQASINLDIIPRNGLFSSPVTIFSQPAANETTAKTAAKTTRVMVKSKAKTV